MFEHFQLLSISYFFKNNYSTQEIKITRLLNYLDRIYIKIELNWNFKFNRFKL